MEITNGIIYSISYVLFFALSWIGKTYNSNRLTNDDGDFTLKPGKLIAFHVVGIIVLGLVPVILLNHPFLTVLTGNKTPNPILVLLYVLIFIIVVTLAFRQGKSVYEKKQGLYKSLTHLSSDFFISYFIIRALFLFSYELWFRGFLLFDSVKWIGISLAVWLNILLYVLVHVFNSKKERWACIPFGIMVCALNLLFDAVWPAIILHVGFSLVYELTIYRLNLNNFKIAKS